MNLKPYISEQKEQLIELRRYLHRHPEPGLRETETAKKIEEELDAAGIEHRRVGGTGIAAVIRGRARDIAQDRDLSRVRKSIRVVALRADIDALPIAEKNDVPYRSSNEGFMHACGHDAHAASLVGAARALKSQEEKFAGEVRIFFQQGEEIGQGARQFIEAGLLDGVDAILGTHVSSAIPVGNIALVSGPTNASCDYFRITVHGSSAHVSTPHLGTDAVYIASKIVVDLQAIVARHTDPLDSVVVGVGIIRGGTNYNIIANEAIIEGTTRSFTEATRNNVNESVRKIAELAAKANGACVEFHFESYAAPLVNDQAVTERARRDAASFADPDEILLSLPKSLGADDFADYLRIVPGTYAFIGSRNEANPSTARPHHHELFDIDENAILIAAELYADFALDVLGFDC